MSMQEFMEEVKSSSSDKSSFYLATGANIVRFVSKPIEVREAFCISTYKDKTTGEEKVSKRSELIYKDCGYEKYASPKFVVYAIDSKDAVNEDGTPKIKTLTFGWKVLEGIVAQEKANVLQGNGKFDKFPLDRDFIISKEGQGQMGTTYAVSIMNNVANNKVPFTIEEISTELFKLPTLQEWRDNVVKETIARHEKFGKPKAEKQIKDEQELSKATAEIPEIQIDAEEDGDPMNFNDQN